MSERMKDNIALICLGVWIGYLMFEAVS